MCSVLYLRDFIKERLTAVCEEIFSEVQKTFIQYEEEINRQFRLQDISRKLDTHSHITDVQQQYDCEEEEGLTDQPVCNQERNSSLDQEDPEPPQIKVEQEELCNSQEGEQLGLKQEGDTFTVTLTYEGSEHSEPEPMQAISHSAPEENVKKRSHCRKRSHSQRVDKAPVSEGETDTSKKFLECDTCGKPFIFKSHLIAHLRVHTGEKPYSCVTCEKRFGNKSDLGRHIRIHTGKNAYPCSICGKKLIQKSDLEHHIKIHTGEKPYACSTCGKQFIQRTNLKTHMRIHTGEKPYLCSTCGKRFGQSGNLKSHMKIHSG